jgi:hypothetical protein
MKLFLRSYRFLVIFLLIMAWPGGPVCAQETPEVFYPPGMEPLEGGALPPAASPPPAVSAPSATVDHAPPREGSAALPRSYRGIGLGMSLEDLKGALQKEPLLNFRGDRDVSFLPSSARSQNVVETTGPSFIRRAFFQLWEDGLFIMGFSLHTGLVDHYSVFTGLVKKYGEPLYLDPKEAVWEAGDTRISLERPLTVKYIDLRVFNELIGESTLIESAEIKRRQEFLDEF